MAGGNRRVEGIAENVAEIIGLEALAADRPIGMQKTGRFSASMRLKMGRNSDRRNRGLDVAAEIDAANAGQLLARSSRRCRDRGRSWQRHQADEAVGILAIGLGSRIVKARASLARNRDRPNRHRPRHESAWNLHALLIHVGEAELQNSVNFAGNGPPQSRRPS